MDRRANRVRIREGPDDDTLIGELERLYGWTIWREQSFDDRFTE